MDKQLLTEYRERYDQTQGLVPDRLAEFGRRYREQGHLTRDQLYRRSRPSASGLDTIIKADSPPHRGRG